MKDFPTQLFSRPALGKAPFLSVYGGAFPVWLRAVWAALLPFGVTFAGRIAWEKTVWTISRGPQAVGFSLMHIHPGFSIAGILCASLLMLWLIPAAAYAIRRRKFISAVDIFMVFVALFVAAAMFIPDNFFASRH